MTAILTRHFDVPTRSRRLPQGMTGWRYVGGPIERSSPDRSSDAVSLLGAITRIEPYTARQTGEPMERIHVRFTARRFQGQGALARDHFRRDATFSEAPARKADSERAQQTASTESIGDSRMIRGVISTERPVLTKDARRGWVDEVLVAEGAMIGNHFPILDSHQTDSLTRVLGSVSQDVAVDGQLLGVLSFANTPDVDPIWHRVHAGHLREISIGGKRQTWVDIEPREQAVIDGRTWTAGSRNVLRVTTSWIAKEASMVIFGADGAATTKQAN